MASRDRDLPRGRSWPISEADVARAVAEAQLPGLSDIRHYVPYEPAWPNKVKLSQPDLPPGHVLRVNWEPNGIGMPAWEGGPEKVSVWIRDVPSGERAKIAAVIRNEALPELIGWLRAATSAPEGWRVLRHRHVWAWKDGRIQGEEIEPHVLRGRH